MTRGRADLDDVLGAVVAAVRLGLPRVALGQTPRALSPRHRPFRAHPAPLLPPPPLLFSPAPSYLLNSKNRKKESDSPARRTHPQILRSRQRSREIGRAHRADSPPPLRAACDPEKRRRLLRFPLLAAAEPREKRKWEQDETKWAAFLSSSYSLNSFWPVRSSGHQITGTVLV